MVLQSNKDVGELQYELQAAVRATCNRQVDYLIHTDLIIQKDANRGSMLESCPQVLMTSQCTALPALPRRYSI